MSLEPLASRDGPWRAPSHPHRVADSSGPVNLRVFRRRHHCPPVLAEFLSATADLETILSTTVPEAIARVQAAAAAAVTALGAKADDEAAEAAADAATVASLDQASTDLETAVAPPVVAPPA
jgi:hypothetical protein